MFSAATACDRDAGCKTYKRYEVREVPLYNSTSVFDDLAWGGVWLYKATKDARYLGQAQRFLSRHYKVRLRAASRVWAC